MKNIMNNPMFRLLIVLQLCCTGNAIAQTSTGIYYKYATREKREKAHRNMISHGINQNLSLPVADSTEQNHIDAFWALELTRYYSPWIDNCITAYFDSIGNRTSDFQRAFAELVYANYPNAYAKQMKALMQTTGSARTYAICAQYLYRLQEPVAIGNTGRWDNQPKDRAVIRQLLYHLGGNTRLQKDEVIQLLNDTGFLKSKTILFSIQRSNRDYPGIALIRDSSGHFCKDSTGKIIAIPQLARSNSNLPGYLTNGNTPQGIYRMTGFSVSSSNFIGPTTNVQLSMPFEMKPGNFLDNAGITDTTWNESFYQQLLPSNMKNNLPFFESYYAGMAGRTEIIAHGTTIDPEYYKGTPFYPHTPTQGCLCMKEIWRDSDGKRLESNQQWLVDVLKQSGGARGYCVVIEIDDQLKAVNAEELNPYLR